MSQSTLKPVYDAIVVGAGISGTCAAIALAQRGCHTLLVEAGSFPRHKVCGEFLSPESKSVFHRLQALDDILSAGAQSVSHARIVSRDGRAMNTALSGTPLSISRFALDALLVEAARVAGVKVLCGTRVRHLERQNGLFHLHSSHGTFPARAILAASGRNPSWLQHNAGKAAKVPQPASHTPRSRARYVGFKAHFRDASLPPGVVELHAWRGGYCGLVRVENGLTNVCMLARYETVAGRAPHHFWPWLLQRMPHLNARLNNARQEFDWMATGNVFFGDITPLRHTAEVAGLESGVLCCGDAAGFIHPLTGDGMAMAARSGELAAAVLASQLRGELAEQDAQLIYEAAWQREFAARLKWAGVFQRLLIDPQLTAPALGLLTHVPSLGRLAVAVTRGRVRHD
ncbi:MAG: hypothetical protein JWN98_338 [Abditibacteriota bacterium]|nr:hypothetical protein [Abditibacteriota bacterium]